MQYLLQFLNAQLAHEWKKVACKQMSQAHRIKEIIENLTLKNKKYSNSF